MLVTLQNVYIFFLFPYLKTSSYETIQKELNVRCHIEIKLSVISQLSLDRTLFSFALIKTFTRLSSVLANNVK